MKKLKLFSIMTLLIFTLAGCSSTNDSERNQLWIEDIDYLSSTLESKHPNLFFNISKEEYYKKVEEIKSELPSLTDLEIHCKLKELVSSIGDAHTTYYKNYSDEDLIYPTQFTWYKDELRIVRADEKYRDILGMKLVGINDISIEEVIEKMSTIVSYENNQWKKFKSMDEMVFNDRLMYLGISDGNSVLYNLEDDNGNKVSKKISAISAREFKNMNVVYYRDTVKDRKQLVYEQKPENAHRAYWYKFISEDNIFYIQYNECKDYSNDPTYPKFDEFSKELIESLNKNIDNIDKIVVDVRNNTGGDSMFMSELSVKIKENIQNTDIKTYALCSKMTFSSGVHALAELKYNVDATIVGEETGGNLVCYGDLGTIEAPSGKGTIYHSTKKFDLKEYSGLKGEGGVEPDVKIDQTFESYKKGVDEYYEYIKNDI